MSPFDHRYPPGEWDSQTFAETLATTPETYPIPRYADDTFWADASADPLLSQLITGVCSAAASIANEPVVSLPASDFLGYSRTGSRDQYRAKIRGRHLGTLVVAECLERSGQYLDPALDYIWAMCEQSTWTRPPHLRGTEYLEGLPRPVPAEEHTISLQTAMNAKLLAEARYILGEKLHPAARERIVAEIDERVLTPFLARDDLPWQNPPTANHNAVCNASVMVAALHTESDPERQAQIVTKAARNMRHYLNDFDEDGCPDEGVSYWKFGFGLYTQGAMHLKTRTDGEYSLFSPPIIGEIATFPTKVELSPNRFPPFSDANEQEDITPYLLCILGQQFDEPVMHARGREALADRSEPGYFASLIRNLAWRGEPIEINSPTPPIRAYFAGRQWWIARADPSDPRGTVVAAKGGHNGEAHNHNDCGSFVYHVRGETPLTDPGRGPYVDGYFGNERYSFLATRSLGHSVPYVNGCEQGNGSEYAASVIDREATDDLDAITFDLSACYPGDAKLEQLERTITVNRGGENERLVVRDQAAFHSSESAPQFTSMLISFFPMEADGTQVRITGDEGDTTVSVSNGPAVSLSIEQITDGVKDADIWRACYTVEDTPVDLTLAIQPAASLQ